MGRDIAAADIQHWDNLQWVTVASIAGAESYAVAFSAPVTTTAVRLYDIQTSGNDYGLNSVIYEIYVFHAENCPPPPGT